METELQEELKEMCNDLGFMSCAPDAKNIRQLVIGVRKCITEIGWLRKQVDFLYTKLERGEISGTVESPHQCEKDRGTL